MCCSISSPAFSSRLTPVPNSLVALDLTLWSRLTQQLHRKPSTCFCWVTFLPAYQVDSIHKRDPWNSREDMKEEEEVCRQEWWALELWRWEAFLLRLQWNCLSWQVKSHPSAGTCQPTLCPATVPWSGLILWSYEFWSGFYWNISWVAGGDDWRAVQGKACAMQISVHFSQGQSSFLGSLAGWWLKKLLSAFLRDETSQLCLLLGSSSCLESLQLLRSAFIPMEFLEIFFFLFLILTKGKLHSFEAFCVGRTKK